MKHTLLAGLFFVAYSSSCYANFQAVEQALERGDAALAITTLSSLKKQQQSSFEGTMLLGRAYLLAGNIEQAYDVFEQLQLENHKHVQANYYWGVSAGLMAQRASIFSKLGYAKDFLKGLENAIELQPEHLEALKTLIGFHLNAPSIAGADRAQALEYAKRILTFDQEQGFSETARVYWQTEQEELAEKTVQDGLEKFPESSLLYFTRGIHYLNLKRWDKARADLNKSVRFAHEKAEKSQALYQLGKLAVKSKQNIKQGITALMQALPIADDEYSSWIKLRLSQLYFAQGNIEQAKDYIAQIDIENNEELASKVKKLTKKINKQAS